MLLLIKYYNMEWVHSWYNYIQGARQMTWTCRDIQFIHYGGVTSFWSLLCTSKRTWSNVNCNEKNTSHVLARHPVCKTYTEITLPNEEILDFRYISLKVKQQNKEWGQEHLLNTNKSHLRGTLFLLLVNWGQILLLERWTKKEGRAPQGTLS